MEENLRYPIGKFNMPAEIAGAQKVHFIDEIAKAPLLLRNAVEGLSSEQLDTPYRPEGWTVRQVVHHVPDSHLNAYTRMKLALTEDSPVIKPYKEQIWATLPDSQLPVEVSLQLLEALHERWVELMHSLSDEQWQRKFIHPELSDSSIKDEMKMNEEWKLAFGSNELGMVTLEQMPATYAWHGRHHVAHVTSLCERMKWK